MIQRQRSIESTLDPSEVGRNKTIPMFEVNINKIDVRCIKDF